MISGKFNPLVLYISWVISTNFILEMGISAAFLVKIENIKLLEVLASDTNEISWWKNDLYSSKKHFCLQTVRIEQLNNWTIEKLNENTYYLY